MRTSQDSFYVERHQRGQAIPASLRRLDTWQTQVEESSVSKRILLHVWGDELEFSVGIEDACLMRRYRAVVANNSTQWRVDTPRKPETSGRMVRPISNTWLAPGHTPFGVRIRGRIVVLM